MIDLDELVSRGLPKQLEVVGLHSVLARFDRARGGARGNRDTRRRAYRLGISSIPGGGGDGGGGEDDGGDDGGGDDGGGDDTAGAAGFISVQLLCVDLPPNAEH